jgi:hypothetical protein
MNLEDFHNRHKGQTALLVGNGPNLLKTPPEWFDYPSFGLNTIFYYSGGWKPTYYVAVDASMFEQYGEMVKRAFPDVPKFVPEGLSVWGDGFVHFKPHRQGVHVPGVPITNRDAPTKGIGFTNSMSCAMQIAIYMGFKTLLLIGVEQDKNLVSHFWGEDPQMPRSQTDEHWNIGYMDVQRANPSIKVLNISAGSFVPENVLPRGDWKNWKNNGNH